MSSPTPAGPPDPVPAWHDIMRAAATAQQHAYIATALRHAEQQQLVSDNFADPLGPIEDGDERWCRTALAVYDRLVDLDPFQELDVYQAEAQPAETTSWPWGDADPVDQVADLLLPLDGPHEPDRVVAAARAVAELVRRLNHATLHSSALRYPSQLYRTASGLRSGLHGLRQTLGQLATRLDGFATDSRVEHDQRHDATVACAQAADLLRQAATATGAVTAPLDAVSRITSHLGYDTSAVGPGRRRTFPTPTTPASVHEGRPTPVADSPPAHPTSTAATGNQRRPASR